MTSLIRKFQDEIRDLKLESQLLRAELAEIKLKQSNNEVLLLKKEIEILRNRID